MKRAGMGGAMVTAGLMFVDGMVVGGAIVRREWVAAGWWALTGGLLALSLWFRLHVIAAKAIIGFIDAMRDGSMPMREIHRNLRGRVQR